VIGAGPLELDARPALRDRAPRLPAPAWATVERAMRPSPLGGISAALLLAAAIAGCSEKTTSPGPPPVYRSITIVAPTDTLRIGAGMPMNATVKDTNGVTVPNPQLTWSSSDARVASVDGHGTVTGLREGHADITARGGGVTSNAVTLYVIQGPGWVDQSNGAL